MATRRRIAAAYGWRCACGCGLLWQEAEDEIDHIVPREDGGSNADSNLQPLRRECHARKTAADRAAKEKR